MATTAIVLSGGGNKGPIQVGALQSLLEHGIRPDFFVGTSAGSLNSGFMAAYGPTLEAIPYLADAWRSATQQTVYPGNPLTIAWRVLKGEDSIFTSDGMRRLIETHLPEGVTRFGQLQCPCFITAVDLQSRKLYLFGEDPDGPLVEALMASSVVPVFHPPVLYHGLQLVDGGVVTVTPAGVAMDKGAKVIYAVNVSGGTEPLPPVHGALKVFSRTLDTFMSQSLFEDLAAAAEEPTVELHHIHIPTFNEIAFNDFSKTEEMIAEGKRVTDAYLAHPQPSLVESPRGVDELRHTVPGAREYTPRAWR